MTKSGELRNNATNCAALANASSSEPKKRYQRMAEGWDSVAENQEWLDGETKPGGDTASGQGA